MARINLEFKALKDPRFILLGRKMGVSRFDARARMEEIWAHCTENHTHYLTAEVIDAVAEFDGFHTLICEPSVNLAEQKSNGIYIKGTKGRIEWLSNLRKLSKKGGESTKARRLAERQAKELAERQGVKGGPPIPAPAPAPVPVPTPAPVKKEIHTTKAKQVLPLLAQIWNLNCGTLPQVAKTNETRNRKAGSRLREEPDPTTWEAVVRRIAASPFCNGDNNTGWRASFDWLLQPETHLKVLEGKYDPPGARQNFAQAAKERLTRQRDEQIRNEMAELERKAHEELNRE